MMLDIRARLHGLRHRCTRHTALRRGERLGWPGGLTAALLVKESMIFKILRGLCDH